MRKTLFIIGAYLLIQAGLGAIVLVLQKLLGSQQGADATTGTTIPSGFLLPMLLTCSILTAIAAILICRKGFSKPFEWRASARHKTVAIALSILTTIPLVVFANCAVETLHLPDTMADSFSLMSQSPWALLVMAVTGPTSEEICFRYGVTGSLCEQFPSAPVMAIIASAVVFGIIHMNPAQSFNATLLGLFFSWLYVKTQSIWPSMMCHILNNAIAVVIFQQLPQDTKIADLLPAPHYIYLVMALSAIAAITLLRILNKRVSDKAFAGIDKAGHKR